MNGSVFLAYVQQVLVPTLSMGDIVVMDNLPAQGGRHWGRDQDRRVGALLGLTPAECAN